MALVNCAECGEQVSDKSDKCVKCGAPNAAFKKPIGFFPALVLATVLVIGAFLAFGMIVNANDPTSDERANDRAAISYCEDQYEAMKANPGISRGALVIAYGGCEKLKQDYRAKWNRNP